MERTPRYDYLTTRDEKVLISFKGRIVKILKDADARAFLTDAKAASDETRQTLLRAAAAPLPRCG